MKVRLETGSMAVFEKINQKKQSKNKKTINNKACWLTGLALALALRLALVLALAVPVAGLFVFGFTLSLESIEHTVMCGYHVDCSFLLGFFPETCVGITPSITPMSSTICDI